MKRIFFGLLTISFMTANAQAKIIKYYTEGWMETSKEKAAYYAEFIKEGSNYSCTSYWINTQKVRGKSVYADTLMKSPIGIQLLYSKNGHLEDSSSFENNELKYSYHYYPNGQLAMHYFLPDNKKEGTVEGYDESGKKIKNYIFQREAEFKGGQKAWTSYINKSATKDFPAKGKEEVTVTVKVEFIVDENGEVITPKILASSGYKNVDNDALQVIANSPSWKNAVLYNQPVNAYRVQPIIYTLQPEKK